MAWKFLSDDRLLSDGIPRVILFERSFLIDPLLSDPLLINPLLWKVTR